MRIDRFIATQTPYSRKAVKGLLKAQRVWVDGKPIRKAGTLIDPQTAQVTLDREPLVFRERVILVMHKPKGVVCATSDGLYETALDLAPAAFRHRDLKIVGRLDVDTTGLLLLTDDGELLHRLTHPRRHVAKVYHATYSGTLDDQAVAAFKAGITLKDGTTCRPAVLKLPTEGSAEITIHEGRYHQVKRMVAACGARVTTLHRNKIGELVLDPELLPGQSRELTPDEESALLKPLA